MTRLRRLAAGPHDISSRFDDLWERRTEHPDGPIDVIDMFSGCGGMSAGFLALNGLQPAYRLAAAIDIDPIANRTYADNLGIEPREDDVSNLAEDRNLRDALLGGNSRSARPLVLIGCAPCQGFSSHRNAAGGSDKRNNLFVDFAKVALRLRPDAVVVENVPELLTYRYWPYVEEAKRLLLGAGYSVYLGVHNVAEFGVPQERFRALLLAMRGSFAPPHGFLSRDEFRTVRGAIGALAAVESGSRSSDDPMHYSAGHRPETVATIRAVPKDGGNRPPGVGPASLQRIRERQGRDGYEDVYGRLHWDRPSITVTAYARNPASGRYVHPEQDRGLTIREAALLQGFPADYRFAGTLDQAFRQIGNAVPPLFATCLGAHVYEQVRRLRPAAASEAPRFFGIEAPVGQSFARLIPSLKAGRHVLDGGRIRLPSH